MYNENWTLPVEGHVGYIESITLSGFVLGVWNDSTTAGTNVDLEVKKVPISEGQKWIKGKANANGWFTLANPNSGKTLELHVDFTSSQATIEGNLMIAMFKESLALLILYWSSLYPS